MRGKKAKFTILGCIALLFIIFIAVKVNNLMNSIREDWEISFSKNKSFFREYSFSGKVIGKMCLHDALCPYSITIELDTSTVIPKRVMGAYYDFYVFNSENKTLKFVVPEEIYKNVDIKCRVVKKGYFDSIYIGDKSYLLFSNEKFKWLP